MNSEAGLWQHMIKWWKPFGKIDRIETGMTTSGVPDVDAYFKQYGSVKIELKFCKKFLKGLELRPAQHRYMQDRIKFGDRDIWIFAAIDDPSINSDVMWMLIHSSHSRSLIENKSCANWLRHAEWTHEGDLNSVVVDTMMDTMFYNRGWDL